MKKIILAFILTTLSTAVLSNDYDTTKNNMIDNSITGEKKTECFRSSQGNRNGNIGVQSSIKDKNGEIISV